MVPATVFRGTELSALFSNRVRRINAMLLHFRDHIIEASSWLISVVI